MIIARRRFDMPLALLRRRLMPPSARLHSRSIFTSFRQHCRQPVFDHFRRFSPDRLFSPYFSCRQPFLSLSIYRCFHCHFLTRRFRFAAAYVRDYALPCR
jgi:hypothetical protein